MASQTNQNEKIPAENSGMLDASSPLQIDSATAKGLFLQMDLNNSDSVCNVIPRIREYGQIKLVPGHIRGGSRNPWKTVVSVIAFRRFSQTQQETERAIWKDCTRQQKQEFQVNLTHLQGLRDSLMKGTVKWDDVASNPLGDGDHSEMPRPKRVRQYAQASKSQPTPNRANAYTWEERFTEKWRILQAESEDAAIAAMASQSSNADGVAGVARRATFVSPAQGTATAENMNPNLTNLVGDSQPAEERNKYVGRGSDEAAREKAAKKAEEKAKSSNNTRPKGVPATKLSSQGDSVTCETVEAAFKSVARASDTIYVPSRQSHQPRRVLLLMDVTEVKETAASGGAPDESNIQCNKTMVRVMGPADRAETIWAVENLLASLKHEETRTHDRIELYRNSSSNLVQPIVSRYFDLRAEERGQPKVTDPSLRERIQSDHLNEPPNTP